MVRSHAKNNTTQANLSYYERSLLRREGAARRVGADSMKPLDHCYLCLSRAASPVACGEGHIFCRECALTDLLTQKAGIVSQKRELERWDEQERLERDEAVRAARERVVRDFEKGMALGGNGISGRSEIVGKVGDGVGGTGGGGVGYKLDQGMMERATKEAEDKARRRIEEEQEEGRRAKLPAFWLPSLAPEAKVGRLSDVKLQTVCQAGKGKHPMSRKTLLPVQLTYPTPTSTTPICPTCTRELSNATPTFLLSSRSPASTPTDDADEAGPKRKKSRKDDGSKEESRPFVCGHVLCGKCVDTVVRPQGRCGVCEAEVGEAGIISLGKEGTGFAAKGGAEARRSVTVFRV